MLEVKPLLASEWPVLKAVRLRALADVPNAFSTTVAQAQAYSDTEWQMRAGRFMVNPPAAMRIAYLDGTPCGMMSCYPASPESAGAEQVAELTAVWVDSTVRGQGIGEALVASIVGWAVAQGIGMLQAWVTEGSHRAIAFYKKVGFEETGQRQAEGPDAPQHIILMARMLTPAAHHSSR